MKRPRVGAFFIGLDRNANFLFRNDGFVSVPRPSTVTAPSHRAAASAWAYAKAPTPGGVPVEMMSPGSKGVIAESIFNQRWNLEDKFAGV